MPGIFFWFCDDLFGKETFLTLNDEQLAVGFLQLCLLL